MDSTRVGRVAGADERDVPEMACAGS